MYVIRLLGSPDDAKFCVMEASRLTASDLRQLDQVVPSLQSLVLSTAGLIEAGFTLVDWE